MRGYRVLSSLFMAVFCAFAFSLTAFADSSWVWISETRPFDILPWVIVITLAVETISINFIPNVRKLPKVFCVVAIANILSFAAPYLINYFLFKGEGFDFDKYLNHWPSYIVGILYGIITIAVEFPVVYHALKKDVTDKRKLMVTIVLANVVTTGIVALFEHIFCQGSW